MTSGAIGSAGAGVGAAPGAVVGARIGALIGDVTGWWVGTSITERVYDQNININLYYKSEDRFSYTKHNKYKSNDICF